MESNLNSDEPSKEIDKVLRFLRGKVQFQKNLTNIVIEEKNEKCRKNRTPHKHFVLERREVQKKEKRHQIKKYNNTEIQDTTLSKIEKEKLKKEYWNKIVKQKFLPHKSKSKMISIDLEKYKDQTFNKMDFKLIKVKNLLIKHNS